MEFFCHCSGTYRTFILTCLFIRSVTLSLLSHFPDYQGTTKANSLGGEGLTGEEQ